MANYVLVRQLCGIWFALDALHFLIHPQLWLGRGHDEKHLSTHPASVFAILAVWLLASTGLIVGRGTWIASLVLLVLFRHYYIGLRWRSLLRGVGAVGFMPYWTALYLFAFESISWFTQHGVLEVALFRALRIDFALIFICAGTYKALTGYVKGEGVEYALSNPMWTYGFKFFAGTRPSGVVYRLADLAACLGQIVLGLLLLVPSPRLWMLSAVGMGGAFLTLAILFRIGRLGPLMATIPLLFLPELGFSFPAFPSQPAPWTLPAAAVQAIEWLTYAYILLLPIVKVVQYTNLFLDRSLPKRLQAALNRYAGLVPIIIWRVFSVDITNFFVRISLVTDEREEEWVGEGSAYSPWSWKNLWFKLRYLHVGESVAIAAMFNTQKHFASQPEIFNRRLLRYSRGLPAAQGVLKFEYVLIVKAGDRMEYRSLVSYYVDRVTESVREERHVADLSPASKARFSPIREAVGFGTYVRKGS